MTIEPDTKNWTWVLERPCPDCGFDPATTAAVDVPELTRAITARWADLLRHPAAAVRPQADRWSAVEYGCHVRDVFVLFAKRLALMLAEDDPTFANWDQDATAIADGYARQNAADVAAALVPAGLALADAFAAVTDGQWPRTGRRSDGAVFTVDSFARYFVHDPMHHVWDVERGYAALAGD